MNKESKMSKETKEPLVDYVEGAKQLGTPTMVMLPAGNYYFKVLESRHKITITRAGLYHELDPEFFTKEDGEFNIYDVEKSIIYLPSITKVLFGEKKYPALKQNQLFAPIALVLNEDTVDVLGQILELLPPPTTDVTSTAPEGE